MSNDDHLDAENKKQPNSLDTHAMKRNNLMEKRPGPTLFVIFNHTLTPAQEKDARESLGAAAIVLPPPGISRLWAEIPPAADSLADHLAPVTAWLGQEAGPEDYALIQGEFGATWLMVAEAFRLGLVPVYSTTRREAVEEHLPDGRVEIRHCFSHVRYRRYGA